MTALDFLKVQSKLVLKILSGQSIQCGQIFLFKTKGPTFEIE